MFLSAFPCPVESCLVGQPGKLVQVVRHSHKIAYDGCFLRRMPGHNPCFECGFPDELRQCAVRLSAAVQQPLVINPGELYRHGFGKLADTTCFRSASGSGFILVTHITWFTVIGHFTVMICPAICDRWERIASATPGVERGFRDARKITSLTPETDVPSVDRLWRVLNAGMPSFHDADGFCTGCLLQFAPPLEVFRIDFKMLPGDIFQQS